MKIAVGENIGEDRRADPALLQLPFVTCLVFNVKCLRKWDRLREKKSV